MLHENCIEPVDCGKQSDNRLSSRISIEMVFQLNRRELDNFTTVCNNAILNDSLFMNSTMKARWIPLERDKLRMLFSRSARYSQLEPDTNAYSLKLSYHISTLRSN